MCNPKPQTTRKGERLCDGHDHTMDHAIWTRRQFLRGFGMVAAGASLTLAGTPVSAFHGTSLLSRIALSGTNRILVIVQLNGGNDGLNTVVPINNDIYYNARPNISISANAALPISNEIGLHPDLGAVHNRYLDGDMAIIQGVGYPSPNLSHFLSTDVWMTGQEVDNIGTTGWSGRHLDAAFPNFEESPPDAPLAVQIGAGTPFLFQGPTSNMGMALANLGLFEQIAETGQLYDESNLPDSVLGNEIGFVRSVANSSFRYAESIGTAAGTENDVEYPNNSLADELAIVARLIKGGLGTSIYHVSLGGFDTHSNQAGRHRTLMQRIGQSVDAFQRDVEASGRDEEVLVMTFSEFGRRVYQNGSNGTDHGTAAPMFLFGKGVSGGVYGDHPDLSDLDNASNMKFTTDFRSVYASVLLDWFGLDEADVSGVLGGEFPSLSFIANPTSTHTESAVQPSAFTLEQNYPNPFNPSTRIAFDLGTAGRAQLEVFDISGRSVIRLIDSVLPAGRHEVRFDAGGLASGTYVYRLRMNGRSESQTMTLLR